MERYQENSRFNVTVSKKTLKISISIKDLEFLLRESPNNWAEEGPVRVKRGKRAEFADFVARFITEETDSETGEPPLLQMFEEAFMQIFEGDEEFCMYPDEGQEG